MSKVAMTGAKEQAASANSASVNLPSTCMISVHAGSCTCLLYTVVTHANLKCAILSPPNQAGFHLGGRPVNIDIADLSIGSILGKGSFAVVSYMSAQNLELKCFGLLQSNMSYGVSDQMYPGLDPEWQMCEWICLVTVLAACLQL